MKPNSDTELESDARTALRLDDLPDILDVQMLADLFGADVSTVYAHHRGGTLGLEPIPWGGRLRFSRYSVERLLRGEDVG